MKNGNKNDEVYLLYGRFLVNFEHVSHLMRNAILYLVFPKPTPVQIKKTEILLESLTADQVRRKFIALVNEEYASPATVLILAKAISNIYEKLIPIRNSFAHGTSFIGNSEVLKEAEDGLLLLRHPKLNKGGLDLNLKRYEIKDLKLGINLLDKIKYAIAVLSVNIIKKSTNEVYADGYSPNSYHESISTELVQLGKELFDSLKK